MINLLNKKDEWSIKKYGTVNISHIKNEILSFKDEWLLDTSRQKNNLTHEHTQMFQLRFFHYDWNKDLPGFYKNTNSFKNKEAVDQLEQIYSLLEKEYNGKVVRVEVIDMMPFSRIRKHRDRSDMLFLCRRVHIPIKTNSDAIFSVNGESMHMDEGGIYEINNIKIHNVFNYNPSNRIHMIIDILPEPYASNVSLVTGDKEYLVNTNINNINYDTRCRFCITSEYCIGPHIPNEHANSFFEYIGTIVDDLSYLSIDVINDYAIDNNLDLSKLSEKLFYLITNRKY